MPPSFFDSPRPGYVPGGSVHVVSFIVGGFDAAAAAGLAAVATPSALGLPHGVAVHLHGPEDRAFTGWIREVLDATDPPHPSALAASAAWVELSGDTGDRPDHAALGAAWRAVRRLVLAAGPSGALWDGLVLAWRSADEVRATPPDDPRLAAAWRCDTVDGLVGADGAAFVCVHTLGLAKFGRRDLVAFGGTAATDLLRDLVSGLGRDLIDGGVLHPGDRVARSGLHLDVLPYVPGETGPPLDVPFFVPPLVVVPAGP